MARKKKRGHRKPAQKKHSVVDDNEKAFLSFVDQNAKQISGLDESVDIEFANIDTESESSSSSSASEIGGSFHAEGSSDASAEATVDMGEKKSTKKRGRPPKKRKLTETATYVKPKSLKGLSPLSGKGKQSDMPCQDPQYNKKELKASLSVIKKVMEMDEAVPFNSPVDPVLMRIPDYYDVIDTPMDFGTICNNLQNGVKYLNAADVYKDVRYIWENCLTYNKKGDYIVYLMKRVKKKFMKCWTAAGLQSETQSKAAGHAHVMPLNDRITRHCKHDPISVVNHVVGGLNQMQLDNFCTVQPPSPAPLSSYSNPYHSHVPQPSTFQPPQCSHLQAGIDSNYAGHSHVVQSNDCGMMRSKRLHYVHINDRGMRRRKRRVILTADPMVGKPSQMQLDCFGTIQPESQVPLPNYNYPYKSPQSQPCTTQPPQLPQLRTGTENYYTGSSHIVYPSDHATRSKHDASSMVNHMVGNPSQMQQDNTGTIQPSFQVALSCCSQPYHLHQHQPTSTQPQVSQLQAGTDSNCAGHNNMKRKKYETRSSVATMMSGPTQFKQQQPQLSSCCLRQSRQNTCQPQPSQSYVADGDNAGCPHTMPSMDCAMGHDGFVSRCPVDPMVINPNELQTQKSPLSRSQPNESHQHFQASIGQPQPSQPVASVGISIAEHSCLPVTNPSKRGRTRAHRSSADGGAKISLVSSCLLPQQPSANHNHPDQSQQPAQGKKNRTRPRGPTMCRDLWDMRDGERIVVPVNIQGQPVGPEAAKLNTFLGTVARNGEMVPLTCVDWYAMPDENKVAMWQFVQSIASKWRNWKAKLKADHYYPYKTDEERLQNYDKRVLPNQWRILVSYWNSEEAQVRSAKNKANRANLKSGHTAGQKSFARICEEEKTKRPDGKEPTRAELYIKTHTRKDGRPVNEVAAEIIAKLREQENQEQQASDGRNESDDAFFQVTGEEKGGDMRGQKRGHTEPKRKASLAKRSADDEVSKMLNKMEAMEQKYATMEAQIASMTSNMQNFLDKMGDPSKALGTKQVPNNSSAPRDSLQAQVQSSSSSHAVQSNEGATPISS